MAKATFCRWNHFDETELTSISNALRVAGDKFKENVKVLDQTDPRLAQQFKKQADTCEILYNEIADGTGVAS